MAPEGMVHALEAIHRLLKPDGCLIDILPLPEAPLAKIIQGGKITFSEPVPALNEQEVRQAEAALAHVVQRRLFVVEWSQVFDFLIYAPSVYELRNFLEEANAFQDSPPDEAAAAAQAELAARLEEALPAAGEGAEVAFHERATITRLMPR
jgi:SAM-dependent methyltransferase